MGGVPSNPINRNMEEAELIEAIEGALDAKCEVSGRFDSDDGFTFDASGSVTITNDQSLTNEVSPFCGKMVIKSTGLMTVFNDNNNVEDKAPCF